MDKFPETSASDAGSDVFPTSSHFSTPSLGTYFPSLTILPHATSAAAASLSGGAVSTPSTAPYARSPGIRTSTEAFSLKGSLRFPSFDEFDSYSFGVTHRFLFCSASARDSQYARARALCASLAAASTSMDEGDDESFSESFAANASRNKRPASRRFEGSCAFAFFSVGECARRLCAAGSCRGRGGGDRSREERFSFKCAATRPPAT
mmetsp:Transcript_2998/g.12401  ORF Transcript_2998/g.12401 Transcript_2998/m.12401 type:complete len:207 (-) Transcript_2998:212-832(-)